MEITCSNLSKKFHSEWVFKGLNFNFLSGQSYAIIGSNGSGKSTLLQCLSGMLPLTSGSITYTDKNSEVAIEDFYKYISIAAPYLELLEDYTLLEHINFHLQFIKLQDNLTAKEFISILRLDSSINKPIKNFSSGMKQKVKLGLAIYSDRPILLLDEPTSNLDSKGILWYKEEVEKVNNRKLLIIGSNQEFEYDFCGETIDMRMWK
ncbi:MAG TPA: ABC transporter ATP-binding protein [Cytophagaceae bacterium]